MLAKITVHVLAASNLSPYLVGMDEFSWYHFAAVFVGLLLVPSVLGKSRAPDSVVAEIAAMKKIIEEAGMPSGRAMHYWSIFLDKFIRNTNVGANLPSPDASTPTPESEAPAED